MAGSFQLSKPMTVKEISAKAQDFEFNPFVALKFWLRTAESLRREAQIYEAEENNQQAYLLLMRYAILITEVLPSHPSARDPTYRPALKEARKSLQDVFDRLEVLKPKIEARYALWLKALERRRQASAAVDDEHPQSQSRNDFSASDPAIAGNATAITAAEHEDYAVKVAHKEIRRRDAARRATRQAGVSEEEEQERRTAGLWDDWEAALSRDTQSGPDNEMQRAMIDSRRRLEAPHDILPDPARNRLTKANRTSSFPAQTTQNGSAYRYPSIARSQPLQFEESPNTRRTTSIRPASEIMPSRPPKERYDKPTTYSDLVLQDGPLQAAPELPPKTEESDPAYTFRPAAYLENGNPLRTVWINSRLRETFLKYASANTKANLETCGMLCGTLVSNALFVSKLVIPEQTCTSDTCETVNESAFFDYCASEDLMVLGWIHTHPTQTCFMSSRDLHTHCGYQVMMPESIAIVCAPSKNPSWGCFRLTDPPGMKSVLNCRQTGVFHPHAQDNLYTDALRPGHVYEVEGLKYDVVDMRP
ncbi:endosome-associated ubiquitin isopeptidase (AmsH)-like protein [Coleophoma crateriformis]|uniref:Endosome-associated ubiquitin isopeptidase (AmsH)-like protein n=1 Tax=Coleophoma crateriformis TaxID=565419 RepID=A0A3D8RWX9_9HELO|nr:endosome-associated ubiquitin isopeptidase (AmsH)-like protein [Coleophoma crateriformis]